MPVRTKITKKDLPENLMPEQAVKAVEETKEVVQKSERSKKGCFFCQNKKEPEFTDSVTLRKFMSDRARIQPKLRTGTCSKHQRALTSQIKYARHLALLPFIPSV